MIRIAITAASFDTVAATLALGTVSIEPAFNGSGELH
jgi:hypothetical protein